MSSRTVFRVLVALVPLAACASVAGLNRFEIVSGPDAAIDAAGDAAVESAAPVDDAEGDACAPPEIAFTHVMHLVSAPAIDAKLDDWPCAAFTELDPRSANYVRGTPLDSAQIALGWDALGVYFACHVTDPKPEGVSILPYTNDACELYLGIPPPDDAGLAATTDLHLVVDYMNQHAAYRDTNLEPFPDGIVTAATVTATGFDIELFVPAAILGYTPAGGLDRRFDLQLDDCQNGVGQTGAMWSYLAPDAAGCDQPSCNTLLWGDVTFAP